MPDGKPIGLSSASMPVPPWGGGRFKRSLRGDFQTIFDSYGAARVNAACARALAFELLDVRRVEAIVGTALEREPGPAERGSLIPLPARFARAPASFAHPPREEASDVPGDRA